MVSMQYFGLSGGGGGAGGGSGTMLVVWNRVEVKMKTKWNKANKLDLKEGEKKENEGKININ